MKRFLRTRIFLLFLILTPCLLFANNEIVFHCSECSEVFYSGPTASYTDSVTISWFDFSEDPVEWELELGPAGFEPIGTPNIPSAKTTNHTLKNLSPGTEYHVYIRTICSTGMSDWEGPFFFRTHFNNQGICQTDIQIRDNSCNSQNEFGIEVSNLSNTSLGIDILLSSIDLVIDHGFPSDLEIFLTSPSGIEVELSSRNGIATDHYGDPDDQSCAAYTRFDMQACESIEDGPKPYIGAYSPEGNLYDFNDNSNPNGTWILKVCDIATGDRGTINYLKLNFVEAECALPDHYYVEQVDHNEALIRWSASDQCQNLQIEYGPAGFVSGTGLIIQEICSNEFLVLSDLIEDTTYEIELTTLCGSEQSPKSCRLTFQTTCHPVSLREDFDEQIVCDLACGNFCDLDGLWFNSTDDAFDWLPGRGPTPTEFTGPSGDISGFGQYLYLESFATDCNIAKEAILESSCLLIQSNGDGCDMSFQYHMLGIDVSNLLLEISTNDGIEWSPLWEVSGEAGSEWQQVQINLSDFENEIARMRFVGTGPEGSFGDIALDDILFYGTSLATDEEKRYFVDRDNDGFGLDSEEVILCRATAPDGFSRLPGDCNDDDETVYPGAPEIPCNLIDENCNGLEDDPVQSNPLGYQLDNLVDEFCGGSSDGSLQISGTGGTPPYSISWNNGENGGIIDSLTAGVYYATITDANGCLSQTEFFEINTQNEIALFIMQMINPECENSEDGTISISQTGGTAPFQYLWNNGDTTSQITSLSAGNYKVTITDANGCQFISDPIQLNASQMLNVGVVSKKNVSCFGGSNGQIQISIGNGQAPFDIAWSHGDSSVVIGDLSAGSYSCTITDAAGCTGVLNDITISQPDSLYLRLDGKDDNTCFGGESGSIQTSVVGGSPPFSFSWSNGGFSDDIFHLAAGSYDVTVTDKNFCSSTLSDIQVSQAEELEIQIDSIKNVNCLLSTDGFIAVSVEGGTAPYQYFWNYPGSDTAFIDQLPVRSYQLTILDNFSCKKTLSGIEIMHNNVPLDVAVSLNEPILCHGDSTGSIVGQSSNGTLPYDFNWSSGDQSIVFGNSDTLDHLKAGTYQLTMTDSEGCVGMSQAIQINQPLAISYELVDLINAICFGDKNGLIDIDAEGGTGELSYRWSNGALSEDLSGIPAGSYSVSITDENECQVISQEFDIGQGEEILISTSSVNAINNMANGSAKVSPSGGTAPYFYLWDANSGDQTTMTAVDLFPGEYFVTITDSKNCEKDTSVIVDNTVSTENDLGILEFIIYPNPTSGSIHLQMQLHKSKQLSFKIYDLMGQLHYQKHFGRVNQVDQRIDLTLLPSGVYLAVFEIDNHYVTHRVVVF